MKRLYVGCRVRIVDDGHVAEKFRMYIGLEGRIVSVCSVSPFEWYVVVCGDALTTISDVLEPIQDPGHQVGTWEGCVWKPEWVRAWSA